MDDAEATERLWSALTSTEHYIANGLVKQMSSSKSFGGKDMKPVIQAYRTFNEIRPFLPMQAASAADHAFEVLQSELNLWLDRLREAVSATDDKRQHATESLDHQLKECHEKFTHEMRLVETALRHFRERSSMRGGVEAHFYGPVSGTVNFGEIIGNIASSVRTLSEQPSTRKFAEAIDGLTKAVQDDSLLSPEDRTEALQNVKTLGTQATLSPPQRESGVFKAALKYVPMLLSSTVSGIKIWETFGPTIEAFFLNL